MQDLDGFWCLAPERQTGQISCHLLLQIAIFHVERGPFCELFLQCVTYGFYTEPWQEQLYAAFSLMCMFVLPLAILIGTYVSTFITISRSERAFRLETERGSKGGGDAAGDNRRRLIRRAKATSVRISLLIVAAFVVCWTPYYTMMIIFLFLNPDKHLSEDLQSGIFFFGMSNSLVNPIIYGAFHLWRPRRKSRSEYRSEFASGTLRRSAATATPTALGGDGSGGGGGGGGGSRRCTRRRRDHQLWDGTAAGAPL
ncbi:adipokinetic hormone/corazonin-related peptide receptor variant I-like [Schistocerca gregaria]|uniref:adipokinetic hormone/corazonin-related peptide receptor variant I-like n=1 Tax=Schistocerca gregaria TaxID=7010 RepID=UPI00211EB957|nr:adipokinetic hormone/corazonin-related peptide receptor variant I-like [Schistocerca gregaria]